MQPGKHILVADGPKAFAEAVAGLYSDADLWQRLSDNGLEFATSKFSIAVGRRRIARLLSELRVRPFYGTCNVCGQTGSFKVTTDNFRESLICSVCGASSRIRTLADGLLKAVDKSSLGNVRKLAELHDLDASILDTDNFSPISKILKKCDFYQTAMYLPDEEIGKELTKGVWNVDLMEMRFEEASFDVILTSDVLEHVRRADTAHKEIFRCLKPGGTYVFTVPYVPQWAKNQVRVDTSAADDVFLMEKEYHGDPLNPEGALVYQIYGRELYFDLQMIGFDVSFHRVKKPHNGIFSGDLWICRKPGASSVLAQHQQTYHTVRT